jgi:hypothetical protein
MFRDFSFTIMQFLLILFINIIPHLIKFKTTTKIALLFIILFHFLNSYKVLMILPKQFPYLSFQYFRSLF